MTAVQAGVSAARSQNPALKKGLVGSTQSESSPPAVNFGKTIHA